MLHLDLEIRLGERELGRRERGLLDRRDVLGVVEDRPVRVRADLEVTASLALVHVGVHVSHDRKLDVTLRAGEPRYRSDVDHLVDGRRQRNSRSGHSRNARAPNAASDDNGFGLDVAACRSDSAHASVLDVDPQHLRLGGDSERARRLGALAHDRAGAQRVDDSHSWRVETAKDYRFFDVGHQSLDLGR